jgi:hypothetical protein
LAATGAAAAKRVTVSASKAARKGCHTHYVGNRARTDVVRARASETGLVRARLRSRGDWDLGVFDARSKRYVAGSAALVGNEVAEGFVTRGQRLLVQACRFRGRARRARVAVDFVATPRSSSEPVQVVEVSTPNRSAKRRLQGLGLDLTEHGDADSLEVVLYGEDDARKLSSRKFRYRVRIADLGARVRANRAANRIFLSLGVHHAREWPAGEHPLEWAYELLTNYGDAGRATRLVRRTRNIVIRSSTPTDSTSRARRRRSATSASSTTR